MVTHSFQCRWSWPTVNGNEAGAATLFWIASVKWIDYRAPAFSVQRKGQIIIYERTWICESFTHARIFVVVAGLDSAWTMIWLRVVSNSAPNSLHASPAFRPCFATWPAAPYNSLRTSSLYSSICPRNTEKGIMNQKGVRSRTGKDCIRTFYKSSTSSIANIPRRVQVVDRRWSGFFLTITDIR